MTQQGRRKWIDNEAMVSCSAKLAPNPFLNSADPNDDGQ